MVFKQVIKQLRNVRGLLFVVSCCSASHICGELFQFILGPLQRTTDTGGVP